jgi:hypothetical protein
MKRLLAVAALFAGVAIAQTVYYYVDEAGNVVASDRPPPAGTPYTARETVPSGVTQPGLPRAARPPSVPFPATEAPATLPGTGPADPGAARDLEGLTPADEPQKQRRDLQTGVPADEATRGREDLQRSVPNDEAARQREAIRRGVPASEDERTLRELGVGVPSDPGARERESIQRRQ